MPSAEEYRRRAGECLTAADEATTPTTQAFLRRVAEAFGLALTSVDSVL